MQLAGLVERKTVTKFDCDCESSGRRSTGVLHCTVVSEITLVTVHLICSSSMSEKMFQPFVERISPEERAKLQNAESVTRPVTEIVCVDS